MLLLICAGCAPVYPMDSAGLQSRAIQLAATETAAPVRTAESARNTEQAYADETRQSGQATSAASTAAIGRATEISAEATAQTVRNQALQAQAEYRVTDAWLNAQLTQIPLYMAGTATQAAQVAERRAKTQSALAWLVVWAAWVIAVLIGAAIIRDRAEQTIDALTVARDMARVAKQTEQAKYDVSKQEANSNGANGNDACNQYRADAVHGSQMATEWRPNGNVVQPMQTSDAASLSDDGIPAAGV